VESTEGATTKANQAESNANSYSDLNKVAKVAGKGLSDTNFTQIEKDKLSNLNFSRPSRIIDQTTQYTLVLEDKTKHLKILYPINLIYPAGVFAADDEIQFKNHSSGDVTMVEAATVTLEVVASQTLKVPAKGFGGGRYESATKVGVFGQLKPI